LSNNHLTFFDVCSNRLKCKILFVSFRFVLCFFFWFHAICSMSLIFEPIHLFMLFW
jgi:hypothetical protein